MTSMENWGRFMEISGPQRYRIDSCSILSSASPPLFEDLGRPISDKQEKMSVLRVERHHNNLRSKNDNRKTIYNVQNNFSNFYYTL